MTDQQTDDNKLIAERRAKLSAIREQCRANGFPNSFRRENYADELQAKFGEFDKETLQEQGNKVSIAGRIMAKRGPFMLLQDMTGRIQAYADRKKHTSELQSHHDLVCRLLLEKKKKTHNKKKKK